MSIDKTLSQLDQAIISLSQEKLPHDQLIEVTKIVSAVKARVESLRPKQKPDGYKPTVFLAMPRHSGSGIEPEVLKAGVSGSGTQNKLAITVVERITSALGFNFTLCWCDCINQRPRPDFFAMLHSDLLPHGPWLDTLVEELEKHQLDLIHAVSPIKDSRGVTSTALGNPDDFGEVRRITLTELEQLPDTFQVDDVVELMGAKDCPSPPVLLCNTGCMLIRIGDWVSEFPGFSIHDRIDWVNGMAIARMAPEDWRLGRWMADHGLRVGGTKKVRLDHFTRGAFSNQGTWGEWKRDEAYFDLRRNNP
jgi:hypothetical protein